MKTLKRFSTISIICACILLFCIVLISSNTSAYATSPNSVDDLDELCKEYTEDLYLYGEPEIESNSILYYENYVDIRFDTDNLDNTNINVYDEWIFKIVPERLFELQVNDYFYIGKAYGFYFDYNPLDDTYLLYLIKESLHKSRLQNGF